MKPILGAAAACADAVPADAAPTISASKAARVNPRINTPVLEELSKFEMELPAWCRTSVDVELIETIPHIYAYRSERADDSCAKPEGAKEPRRIELTWAVPHVAALKECIQVERLAHAKAELARSGKERVSER